MRTIVVALFLVFALWLESAEAQLKVEITAPVDKASVPQRPIVEGRASDPSATVWVVVHPLEVSDYWVQPRVTVRANGSWKVQINIGRPGSLDVGKTFEIRAVANPASELAEGKVQADWPKASAISDVIEVTRR
jgi:hypothetical protein